MPKDKDKKVTKKAPGVMEVNHKYTNAQSLKVKNDSITKESDSPEFNNIR
ncbi:MAG: hypothetical protein ACK5LV_07710 [Lachnospirales bacterium]